MKISSSRCSVTAQTIRSTTDILEKIEVKLKRSGLSVQSRKGYYAIKGNFASPVLPYEAPVLAALDSKPKPDSFPFYAGTFSFPDRERMGLAPVIVDVPLSAFTLRVDQAEKVYNTDFSILVLVKDPSGQVVAKLSKQYKLNGRADKVDDAKKQRILFYQEANLPPDRYTVETIAYDAPSGRASVRTGNIEVPTTDESKFVLVTSRFCHEPRKCRPAGRCTAPVRAARRAWPAPWRRRGSPSCARRARRRGRGRPSWTRRERP